MSDNDLIHRAGRLANRAARTGYSVGKRMPGAHVAERGLRSAERLALTELHRRLDQVDEPYRAALSQASAMTRHSTDGTSGSDTSGSSGGPGGMADTLAIEPTAPDGEPLRAAMAELLNHSIGFGADRAREYLYAVILRQLTPDEARIVAALADGSTFPSVDVAERAGVGGTGRFVLRNASTVGKSAGVSLPEAVPTYLTRLAGMGLVDVDAEVPAMETQYEILLTDSTVSDAQESVKRARTVRRSVCLSKLGTRFWAACAPRGRSVTS